MIDLWSPIAGLQFRWGVIAALVLIALAGGLSFFAGRRSWAGTALALVTAVLIAITAIVLQLIVYRSDYSSDIGPASLSIFLLPFKYKEILEWIDTALGAKGQLITATQFIGPTILNFYAIGLVLVPALTASVVLAGLNKLFSLSDQADAETPLLTAPSAWKVYGALFGTIALVGLGIAMLLALDSPGTVSDMAEPCIRAIWVGPCLVFGFLWGAAAPRSRPPGATTPLVAAAADEPAPDIAALYASYRDDFKGTYLDARPATPAPPPSPEAQSREPRSDAARWITTAARAQKLTVDDRIETAIREALDKTWTGNWKERVAILAREEATFLHFLVVAELILMAQDRGTTALVIAPEPSVDRVQAALGEALAAFAAGPTQRIFKVGQEDGASGRYDVVVSSLQRLEAAVLSDDNRSLKDARRRFGLVVILGIHRLDIALLRLRLIRIARQIAKRDVLVFVQGDPRSGLESQLAAVLAPLDVQDVRKLALAGRARARCFQIFWRNDEATLRAFLDKDRGRTSVPDIVLDLPPFTLVRACKWAIRATFFDLAGRTDRAALEKSIDTIFPEGMFCDAEGRRDLRELAAFPKRGQCVIAIEDVGNLVEAAHRSANFKDNAAVLLHVVSHDYPLRDFLASVIAHRPEDQLARYLPITPSPRGGPAELALSIAEEIRRAKDGRLGDGAISPLVDAAEESGVRGRDLSSATSRAGLAELLKSQLGYETTINVTAAVGHERQLEFQRSGLSLEPAYLVRVRQDGTLRPLFLDRVDHGLTYVVGTHLQIRGTFCEVVGVDDDQVRCATRDLPGRLSGGDGSNRPRYVFARLYDPFSDDGNPPMLVSQEASAEGDFQSLRLLLRGRVVRQTVAYREAIELARFLSHAGTWVERDASSILPQTLQVVLRFRISAEARGARPAPAQGAAEADGLARSRAAFTLAATLSDVLHSLFPQHGVRLAVISPQAARAVIDALDTNDQTERFPAIAMPRLATGIEQGHEGVEQRPCDETDAEARLSRVIEQQASPAGAGLADRQVQRFTDAKARFLDLLLIEDASHDLGCLRALFENWPTVVAVWRPYVEWCAANCDKAWFHHWYGGKRLPQIFDFAAAASVIRAMPEAVNEALAEPAP